MAIMHAEKSFVPSDKIDIQILLRKYQQWSNFKNNRIHCEVCDNIVNYANLAAVFEDQDDENVIVICNENGCVNKYLRNLSLEYLD